MSRNRRVSKGKEINPTFWVFCEGETEEVYICYLRSKYRLPVQIKATITRNKITERYIRSSKRDKESHPKDRIYLLYDLDVPEMTGRLQAIKNTILLGSNPCFEFWYLLHFQAHTAKIDGATCLQKLKKHLPNYRKGFLDESLKRKLDQAQGKAVERAGKLVENENPSSKVFELIRELEQVKKSNSGF